MAYVPLTGYLTQLITQSGQVASDYYIKFYIANTTTPLSMATDQTGGTLLAKAKFNNNGIPISNPLDNSTEFIPHLNQSYRLVVYLNAADADANNTAESYVNIPEIYPLLSESNIGTDADKIPLNSNLGDASKENINSAGDVWGAANVEYGSNSNGKYWKYPDGLLICTRISPPSALTVSIGAGNVFRSIALGAEAFPATFSSIPSTSVALIANGGDNQSRWLGLDTTTNVSVSNWGTRVVMDSDSGTGDTGYDFLAIGVWK